MGKTDPRPIESQGRKAAKKLAAPFPAGLKQVRMRVGRGLLTLPLAERMYIAGCLRAMAKDILAGDARPADAESRHDVFAVLAVETRR